MRAKLIRVILYLIYLVVTTVGLFLLIDYFLGYLDETTNLRFPPLAKNTYPENPQDYYKVAFFGESTMQNHGTERGLADMLAYELKNRYPNKRFYFRNFAIPGTTFHGQQAEVAKANVGRYDLILICAGHNEVHTVLDNTGYFRKPDFKGVKLIGGRPTDDLNYLYRWLNYHSRIYAIACRFKQKQIDALIEKAGGVRADIRFPEFKPDKEGLIPPDERPKLIKQYEDDLKEIANKSKKFGTKIIIMTMPSNLLWPPCFSLLDEKIKPQDRKKWEEEFKLGMSKAKEGDHVEAIKHLKNSYEIDPGVAIVSYQLGLSKRILGQIDESNHFLRQSIDSDGYMARMSSHFIPAAKKIAESCKNIRFRDSAKTMEDLVDRGFDYSELFVDLHHPSFLGHTILTQSAIEELKFFDEFKNFRGSTDSDFMKINFRNLERLYFRGLNVSIQDQAEKAMQRINWYISFSDLCAYPNQIYKLAEKDLDFLLSICGNGNQNIKDIIEQRKEMIKNKKISRQIILN